MNYKVYLILNVAANMLSIVRIAALGWGNLLELHAAPDPECCNKENQRKCCVICVLHVALGLHGVDYLNYKIYPILNVAAKNVLKTVYCSSITALGLG